MLEPSAGTGLLAILSEIAGATLILNELAEQDAALAPYLWASAMRFRLGATRWKGLRR